MLFLGYIEFSNSLTLYAHMYIFIRNVARCCYLKRNNVSKQIVISSSWHIISDYLLVNRRKHVQRRIGTLLLPLPLRDASRAFFPDKFSLPDITIKLKLKFHTRGQLSLLDNSAAVSASMRIQSCELLVTVCIE